VVSALWKSIDPHLPFGSNSRAVKAQGRCRLCPSILSPPAVRAADSRQFPIEQAVFARNDPSLARYNGEAEVVHTYTKIDV
jgi:hypothetical protein